MNWIWFEKKKFWCSLQFWNKNICRKPILKLGGKLSLCCHLYIAVKRHIWTIKSKRSCSSSVSTQKYMCANWREFQNKGFVTVDWNEVWNPNDRLGLPRNIMEFFPCMRLYFAGRSVRWPDYFPHFLKGPKINKLKLNYSQ